MFLCTHANIDSSQINQAMRVLEPVLLGSSDSVEISAQAEHDYVWKCQNALRTLVWHKGSCTSVS
jgi:hypothetical protein